MTLSNTCTRGGKTITGAVCCEIRPLEGECNVGLCVVAMFQVVNARYVHDVCLLGSRSPVLFSPLRP